jgi:hypothetical protein
MDPPYKGDEVSKHSLEYDNLYYLDVRDSYPGMDLPIFLVTFVYYDKSPHSKVNDSAIFLFVNVEDEQYNVAHSSLFGPRSILIDLDDPKAKVYAYKQSLQSLLTKQGRINLSNTVTSNTPMKKRINSTISNAAMNRRHHALAMRMRMAPTDSPVSAANKKGGKRMQHTRRRRRSRK